MPKGQIEAAKAVGMHRLLMWRRILMPQVIRYAIPGLGNVWLVLLKATALMSVVGLDELTRKGFIAMGATRKPFTFFIVVSLRLSRADHRLDARARSSGASREPRRPEGLKRQPWTGRIIIDAVPKIRQAGSSSPSSW